MAKIRIGIGSEFNLKDQKVGLGTNNPQERLDVAGVAKGKDLKVTGISSLTAYEGFLRADQQIAENTTLSFDQGPSASLSGEIIVGTGVTVTIVSVGLGTTTVGVGTFGTEYSGGTITNTIDTTDISRAGGSEIECLKVYNTFTPPAGGTNERPEAPKPGELYYNYDFKTIEFFDGYGWRQVDNTTQSGRGAFAGMENPARATVDYIQISTLGNAKYFGDLTDDGTQRERGQGCSSATRGFSMGGRTPTVKDIIDYATLASAGNSIDFGNLNAGQWYGAACSSSTRGISAGGRAPGTASNVMQYIEMGTLGNALDFGDLSRGRERLGALSSTTKGIWGGGYDNGSSNPPLSIIDSVTIASKGNAVRFGELDNESDALSGCTNNTTGLWVGGTGKTAGSWDVIRSMSLASGGLTQYFGDLVGTGFNNPGSLASQTRGVFAGGGNPTVNTISYVQISTSGNSQDFGDLTVERRFAIGWSDSHGGLGGF